MSRLIGKIELSVNEKCSFRQEKRFNLLEIMPYVINFKGYRSTIDIPIKPNIKPTITLNKKTGRIKIEIFNEEKLFMILNKNESTSIIFENIKIKINRTIQNYEIVFTKI